MGVEKGKVTEELLDILEKLKKEGVDVAKIQKIKTEDGQQRTTYLYEVELENIEEVIDNLNLDRNYPIGTKIITMMQLYKGQHNRNMNEKYKRRVEELGLAKNEDKEIEELLDILENLNKLGIDVTKIQQRKKGETTYLHEIKSENIEKIIEELDLDRNYPIGKKIENIIKKYKGKRAKSLDLKYKERIEKLGLLEGKTFAHEVLEILESLQKEGIDVSKIPQTTRKKKDRYICLHEIKANNIEEILKRLNLDRKYPIGTKIASLLQVYKGNRRGILTKNDRKRIEKLGLVKEKTNTIGELLDILEALKKEEIDVTKIQKTKYENKEYRSVYLYEVGADNIEEIIKKLNLNRNYPIGIKISYMVQTYRGNNFGKISETFEKRIENLGFEKEIKKKKQDNAIKRLLDVLESLKAEGIDITKIKQIVVENGKSRHTCLYDIKNDNIEEIINKLGLDRDYKIGSKIANMLQIYKGNVRGKITENDRQRIEEFGLVSELDKKMAEQNLLKKKQAKAKKLKEQVSKELEKSDKDYELLAT